MPPRSDFYAQLKSDTLLPVYVVVSSETALVSEAVHFLRDRVLTAAADFNRDEYQVGDVPVARMVEAAATLPVMAPRRWVHVSQIEKLKAKDHPPLLEYVKGPSPTTVLCLSGSKLDLRTKLGQALNRAKAVFALAPPRQQDLGGWLVDRAERRGHGITRDAAFLLGDLIGPEVGTLDMALDKLALYAGEGATIEVDSVENLVAPTRIHSIFELTDAIGQRHLETASRLLRNALGGGESALMLLAMIVRQLRHLLRLKTLDTANVRPADLARQLGVPPFLIGSLRKQAQRYNASELCAAIDAAARADKRLKSTRVHPGVVLDQLLLEIMAASRPRAS